MPDNGDILKSDRAQPGRVFLTRIFDLFSAPAELCVLLMLLHMLADTAARVVINRGIEGTVESVTYLYMIGVALFPLAALEIRGQHLRVDGLLGHLGPLGAKLLDGFAKIATVLVCVAMAWLTGREALYATLIGENVELTRWSLPIWPGRWVFPLSFALMAMAALTNLLVPAKAVR